MASPVRGIDYEELLAPVADDVLTIGELEALPSLRIGNGPTR